MSKIICQSRSDSKGNKFIIHDRLSFDQETQIPKDETTRIGLQVEWLLPNIVSQIVYWFVRYTFWAIHWFGMTPRDIFRKTRRKRKR